MDLPVPEVMDENSEQADAHFSQQDYKKLGKRKKTDYSIGGYDEFWKQPPGKAGGPNEDASNTDSVLRPFDDNFEEEDCDRQGPDGEDSEVRGQSG